MLLAVDPVAGRVVNLRQRQIRDLDGHDIAQLIVEEPALPTLDRRRLLAAVSAALALPFADPVARTRAQSRSSDRPPYWPTNGWHHARPDAVGLDPAMFDVVSERLAYEVPSLSAFTVAYGGDLVYESYANGVSAQQATDIWSSTKSVTSAAIGIAIGDGTLELASRLGDVIPDRIPAGVGPAVADITVEDLLRMCSGLQWSGPTDYANLDNAPDWVARTLALPLVAAPGTAHTYNSGNSHVLSAVLQAATGQTLRDFSQERIFTPIGVEITAWLESPQGESAGGWGLHITPREMANFGYLYLNGGEWDGTQVVPADWVEASTTFQVQPIETDDFGRGAGYGYHWWLDEIEGIPAFFALGYGESLIYVVPDLDLVITAAIETVPPLDLPGNQARPRPVIRETILPGVAAARLASGMTIS